MNFEWDENKRSLDLQRHDIDFADVWQIFENTTDTVVDERFDYEETRYLTLGLLFGEVVAIEKFGTDVERLHDMKDEDIDFSDIPPLTEEMFKNAVVRKNFKPLPRKNQENLPIDKDIIEFFKAKTFDYSSKINQLLRAYMEEQ